MHGRCHAAAPTVCQSACTLRPAGDIASLVAAKGVVGEVKRQRHRVSAQCVLGMLGPLRGSERSPAPCAPDLIQSVPRIVLRYHAVSEPGQGEPLCTCSLRISAKGQACVIGMHRSDDVLCGSLRAASQGLVWRNWSCNSMPSPFSGFQRASKRRTNQRQYLGHAVCIGALNTIGYLELCVSFWSCTCSSSSWPVRTAVSG